MTNYAAPPLRCPIYSGFHLTESPS